MDTLAVENKWQKHWKDSKAFEASLDTKRKKFFITVPYPYISGSLHIGHARVVTEADVYSRFMRMKGYNVLFPLAFHISGTPVLGISLAIQQGDADKINLYKGYVRAYVQHEREVEKIVQSFTDPWKIVEFFIPKMQEEFSTLGLGIDWRRSYTSGDAEHQALVEWQFRKYKEKGYLVQGKYPVLYSLSLKNAVGEDDIADGDTHPVEKQEFTLLKFKWKDAFLVAATLRPETMFGQTNLWANPDVTYVRAKVDGEEWICSEDCLVKLQHQDHQVQSIGKIAGSELFKHPVIAPVINRELPVLPASFCDPAIGSGIVTSVPSDAPFDWIALQELKKNKALREKYHISDELVMSIKPIPIIDTPGLGHFPAETLVQKLKITSLSQTEKLDEATAEVYKAGFHTGKMREIAGKYAGKSVAEMKDKIRAELLKKNQAVVFHETSRAAKSRDGGKVIVAILDNQWFIDFEAKGWKQLAKKCLNKIEVVPEKYRKQFEDTFAWLTKRPCARLRGLGTKLPFDSQWVIESLSDSTIYMSLYPVVYLMRKHGIKKEQMTPGFFDYVMLAEGAAKDVEKATKIPSQVLDELRSEFDYWYPNDHRHTFQAHLANHLSFMIFAHTAVFPSEKWPRKISFHGMVISGGVKMSKSKGNVITLLDMRQRYGADVFRAYLCYSTSVESTFDWNEDGMRNLKNHLHGIYELLSQGSSAKKATSSQLPLFRSRFERLVDKATTAIADMDLRKYATLVLFEINNLVRQTLAKCTDDSEKQSLISDVKEKWTALLAPLVPHLAEEIWSHAGHTDLVSLTAWPKVQKKFINDELELQDQMIQTLRSDVRTVLDLVKKDGPVTIIVSQKWKYALADLLRSLFETTRNFPDIMKTILATDLKSHSPEISKVLPQIIKDPTRLPMLKLDQEHETRAIEHAKSLLEKEFGRKITIEKAETSSHQKASVAFPGRPAIVVN